jgi:hypothetical protein
MPQVQGCHRHPQEKEGTILNAYLAPSVVCCYSPSGTLLQQLHLCRTHQRAWVHKSSYHTMYLWAPCRSQACGGWGTADYCRRCVRLLLLLSAAVWLLQHCLYSFFESILHVACIQAQSCAVRQAAVAGSCSAVVQYSCTLCRTDRDSDQVITAMARYSTTTAQGGVLAMLS